MIAHFITQFLSTRILRSQPKPSGGIDILNASTSFQDESISGTASLVPK